MSTQPDSPSPDLSLEERQLPPTTPLMEVNVDFVDIDQPDDYDADQAAAEPAPGA